jgi:uncharacterized protein (DUF488 family)
MRLYTVGFTKKTARDFFELLMRNHVKRVIDIRLNNKSQLAGFAKGEDLAYLLPKVAGIDYIYMPDFAPTKELLDGYRDGKVAWDEYEVEYLRILEERDIKKNIDWSRFDGACLLCSEETADNCHRRLLAEYLASINRDIEVMHLVG